MVSAPNCHLKSIFPFMSAASNDYTDYVGGRSCGMCTLDAVCEAIHSPKEKQAESCKGQCSFID